MITVRVSETKLSEQQIEVKCPSCGTKSMYELTEPEINDFFDGASVKLFCPNCSEGFNLDLEY